MSIEHTNRWELVLLVTACSSVQRRYIPKADVGEDIFVPLPHKVTVSEKGAPTVEGRARRFSWSGEMYHSDEITCPVYREQLP
jgi:hypothetical protein